MAQNPSNGRSRSDNDSSGGNRGGGSGNRGGGAGGRGGGAKGGGGRQGGKPGGGGRPGGKKPEPVDPTEALRERLAKVLGRLPETQRRVLEYRMGLVDGHPWKLTDTAAALGISMSEAKQIEERAFAHIRDAIPIQHLQKFLDPSGRG